MFRETRRELGWTDGHIDVRWSANTPPEGIRATAAQFAALKPHVIVVAGAPLLAAMHHETKTIPVVFVLVTDSVKDASSPVSRAATSPASPSSSTPSPETWLEMLKEVVPSMTRVAEMQNPDNLAWNGYVSAVTSIAKRMGVEVIAMPVTGPAEVEPALAAFARAPNGGLSSPRRRWRH